MISPFYLTQISPDPHIGEGLEQTHESSSFPFHILFNADRDQPKPVDRPPVSILPTNEENKNMVEQRDRPPGSGKWMSSKMRIMRKMMRSDDQIVGIKPIRDPFQLVLEEDQGQQSNSSSTSSSNNNSLVNGGIIRVCSDCHTTKTPLWRSGPSGPKSLCNACGIRQRKARRAIAEASLSGTTGLVAASEKASDLQQQQQLGEMKSAAYDDDQQDRTVPFKKRRKNMITSSSSSSSAKGNKTKKKKLHFDDFIISLSNNSALHRVFPQDERDAAILLMALSCGLLIRT